MRVKFLYPNDQASGNEERFKIRTGEVIQFIKGGFLSYDKFIIVDDKTGEIIKVKMSDCKKIN